jgi:hypothetical protein
MKKSMFLRLALASGIVLSSPVGFSVRETPETTLQFARAAYQSHLQRFERSRCSEEPRASSSTCQAIVRRMDQVNTRIRRAAHGPRMPQGQNGFYGDWLVSTEERRREYPSDFAVMTGNMQPIECSRGRSCELYGNAADALQESGGNIVALSFAGLELENMSEDQVASLHSMSSRRLQAARAEQQLVRDLLRQARRSPQLRRAIADLGGRRALRSRAARLALEIGSLESFSARALALSSEARESFGDSVTALLRAAFEGNPVDLGEQPPTDAAAIEAAIAAADTGTVPAGVLEERGGSEGSGEGLALGTLRRLPATGPASEGEAPTERPIRAIPLR